jgi:enterochelin esterase-like enzyme
VPGAMWWSHVSLLDGWLPPTISVSAWGALAIGVAWRRRAIWQWLVVAAAAGGIVALLSWYLDMPARVGSTYPRSFLVWAALPMFALGAGFWQWRVVGWWRRAGAFVAVPLLAASAGLAINSHYGYLPTLGDLLGAPLRGQVDAKQLLHGALRARTVAMYGAVTRLDIPAVVSHFRHREAYVWVPPAYFASPRPHIPVLMLISGTPGAPGDWLRGGRALNLAVDWATAHDGYAPILVLPDANGTVMGDTECVDGPRGQAETYLTVDVVSFMRREFGAPADPRQWAIAGLSEGGTCALELAARHPDLFATFGDFGGDPAPTVGSPARTVHVLYGDSWQSAAAHDPTSWFARDVAAGVEGFFAVGGADRGHLGTEQRIAEIASRDGMRIHLDVIAGNGHTFRTWTTAMNDAYPWIVSRLGPLDGTPKINIVLAHSSRHRRRYP